jgi:hypothetical protein
MEGVRNKYIVDRVVKVLENADDPFIAAEIENEIVKKLYTICSFCQDPLREKILTNEQGSYKKRHTGPFSP